MEETPATVKKLLLFCIFNRVIAASSFSASNSSSFLSNPKLYVGTKSQLVGQRVCYTPFDFQKCLLPSKFLELLAILAPRSLCYLIDSKWNAKTLAENPNSKCKIYALVHKLPNRY